MAKYDAAFGQMEALRYMKPGEIKKLLSRADRAVMDVVHGPAANGLKRRITVRAIEQKTGLSAVAVMLACYRLTGMGLIAEKDPPKDWKMPKRTEKAGSYPRQKNAEPEGRRVLEGRTAHAKSK